MSLAAVAASRIGITLEEYQDHRRRGEKWCCNCRGWHDLAAFGLDRRRGDKLATACRESRRVGGPRRALRIEDHWGPMTIRTGLPHRWFRLSKAAWSWLGEPVEVFVLADPRRPGRWEIEEAEAGDLGIRRVNPVTRIFAHAGLTRVLGGAKLELPLGKLPGGRLELLLKIEAQVFQHDRCCPPKLEAPRS